MWQYHQSTLTSLTSFDDLNLLNNGISNLSMVGYKNQETENFANYIK